MQPDSGMSLTQFLRRYPSLVRLKRTLDGSFLDRHAHDRQTVSRLRIFAPNSSGSPDRLAELTFLSANQTFPFLVHLLSEIGREPLLEPIQPESLCADQAS